MVTTSRTGAMIVPDPSTELVQVVARDQPVKIHPIPSCGETEAVSEVTTTLLQHA